MLPATKPIDRAKLETTRMACASGNGEDAKARWLSLALRAHREAAFGHETNARDGYSDAYHEARMIFADAWNGDQHLACIAPELLICSACNAARHYQSMGRPRLGFEQIESALKLLTKSIESRYCPLALRSASAHHLPHLQILAKRWKAKHLKASMSGHSAPRWSAMGVRSQY